jgi:hypothetical protein
MADTSLIKKLGIKPKQRIILLNAPEGYSEQIGALLPADVELLTTPALAGNFDVVLQFVRNRAEVEKDIPIAIQLVKPGGLLWVSYPKQRSKMTTLIDESKTENECTIDVKISHAAIKKE